MKTYNDAFMRLLREKIDQNRNYIPPNEWKKLEEYLSGQANMSEAITALNSEADKLGIAPERVDAVKEALWEIDRQIPFPVSENKFSLAF